MMRPAGVAAALAAILLATGCSKADGPSIIGHWRAERVRVASVQLPIGPDIVINENEISNPDTDTAIPIKAIERKDSEVVLDFSYGLGLSFYFDGPDRMYVKVPFAGRIYYRRVADTAPVQGQTAAASAVVAPVRVPPVRVAQSVVPAVAQPVIRSSDDQTLVQQAEAAMRNGEAGRAETLLAQAGQYAPAHPAVDFDQAVLAARGAQPDLAIEHLSDAFKRGFRQFDLLDSTQDFDALKSDVRYKALVARYR